MVAVIEGFQWQRLYWLWIVMKTCYTSFYLCAGCLVTCSSILGNRGWTTFLMVLLEDRVMISKVKVQCLAFIGCTCRQWPCWRHCFTKSDFLQGENQDLWSGDNNAYALFPSWRRCFWRISFVVHVLSLVVVRVLLLRVSSSRHSLCFPSRFFFLSCVHHWCL
jgi:hypothetical protein